MIFLSQEHRKDGGRDGMGGQGPRQNLGIRRRERRKEMGGEIRYAAYERSGRRQKL